MADITGRKIEAMHGRYGVTEGVVCKHCSNLISHRRGRKWYKCMAYGLSACASTDWAVSYQACGLFNKPLPHGMRPVIRTLERARREQETPLKGQIDMFGGEADA